MQKNTSHWKILRLTVCGSQAGDLLVEYFGSEKYRKYNKQPWNYIYYYGDKTLINLDEFKEISLRFEAEVRFNII
ncbi:hypothetical protein [Phosphitispora sp. TUW77]|uniref:hypothetical protein n=1 Tax=Phosphitispora sp. TUW77 TaxID=3152361 RepID=UPI003AB21D64